MKNPEENPSSCSPETNCGCNSEPSLGRRDLLRLVGIGSLALLTSKIPTIAGPFDDADFSNLVPIDKKLKPEWVKSLFERGTPTVYRGADLEKIGMPVGGLTAGQLYLGGDGRLWLWDIFNQTRKTREEHYLHPLPATSPLEQGFAIKVDGKTRRLDSSGFSQVAFQGQYPIGTVRYHEPAFPLDVTLEAFSPFVPLQTDDSSLPATIFQFTLKNTSAKTVEGSFLGWLQNAGSLYYTDEVELRHNRVTHSNNSTRLDLTVDARKAEAARVPPRADITFEDWNQPTYVGWTATGTAFGRGPIAKNKIPDYQGDVGGDTARVVNSHSVLKTDTARGKLTSRPFLIERDYISLWIGGGSTAEKTCLNLLVDGQVVRTATGDDSNKMSLKQFNVRSLNGKTATIEIVDQATGNWGNIGVGRILFTDTSAPNASKPNNSDLGNLSLTLLGAPAQQTFPKFDLSSYSGQKMQEATAQPSDRLIGGLGRDFKLKAGQQTTVSFVISWHFPNLDLGGSKTGRHYATRFASAAAVADYVTLHFEKLTAQTKLWRDTWYDSTLPFWFLDRTMANTSTLATSTAFRFADGRFYGWEGVGCCFGTCTHVWHYEQAVGRLFPELDKALREMVDYNPGMAFYEDGLIGYRGEKTGAAADGQAGTILRTYRDHQMSGNDAFLRRNWPQIKKAIEWLIKLDGDENGVWEGPQPNTLDATWYGQVAWLSGLYLASLRAGVEMARDMGDTAFAARCQKIFETGHQNFVPRMWNGEYFIQVVDPKQTGKVGSYEGCEIDQVLGQSWAYQVGLGEVLPAKETRRALEALWKYNFTPDVGPYRQKYSRGRTFAVAGEGGLLMCSWPRGEGQRKTGGFDSYFNECMTGFEHQVAGHMIWEGMVMEGLAIERMIHDRYHAARRNPYNEVECGDHYARAMASYGAFIAACGYEHHGPKGHLGFAPKLTPENFKAPFTTAQGWGTYSQKTTPSQLAATVHLKWGSLGLRTLSFELPARMNARSVTIELEGKKIPARMEAQGQRLTVTLGSRLNLKAGQKLEAKVTST